MSNIETVWKTLRSYWMYAKNIKYDTLTIVWLNWDLIVVMRCRQTFFPEFSKTLDIKADRKRKTTQHIINIPKNVFDE